MKIWIIGRNYPRKDNNQQGSFELEQAHMLKKRGNEVVYIACRFHSPLSREKDGFVSLFDGEIPVFQYTGITTPHFSRTKIHFPYLLNYRNLRMTSLLNRVEEKCGLPDVIHIHYPSVILCSDSFRLYKDKGVKIYTTEHWTKVRAKRLDSCEIKEQKRYLDFANTYMCVGYALREALYNLTNTDRTIIVMPDIINDVFWRQKGTHSGFVFGVIGRLEKIKQVDKIIDVFTELFREKSSVKLVIVGNGSQYEHLREKVNDLKIQTQIVFTGVLTRDDTAKIVSSIDCLVCYSRLETFGVPVIEAWACGIPVITTTANDILEKWDERLGISVDAYNLDSLKLAMDLIIKQYKTYDTNQITDFAKRHYSEEVVYNRLIKLYQE